jgi:NAD(P)-dependent dehydrogenase (short-subunit alcohol dehydrogenase family)
MSGVDLGLRDKVVVVTGGGSGIGRAAVEAFARLGARVTALDRDADRLARLAAEVEGVETREVDVASAADVDAAIDAIAERHGRLDVGVNNAGISRGLGWLHATDEADWDAVLDVNLKGVWLCMRAELRHMYAQRSGVIVNTASAAGLAGGPGVAHYVASKHGVIGLTRTAALEYAPLGIRVNAIAPGTVDTAMSDSFLEERREDPFADALVRQPHPLRPAATADEIADGILYLAGDLSTFTTGSILSVDGGFSAQ